jgi:hypothetical protein
MIKLGSTNLPDCHQNWPIEHRPDLVFGAEWTKSSEKGNYET